MITRFSLHLPGLVSDLGKFLVALHRFLKIEPQSQGAVKHVHGFISLILAPLAALNTPGGGP